MTIERKTGGSDAAELERERQRLLAELLADEGLDAPDTAAIAPRDRAATIPLTFAQEVLWLLDRATPGLVAYNSPLARRIRGPLDRGALERAIAKLVERHESLRTIFVAAGDTARQVVQPAEEMSLQVHDVSALPESERLNAAVRALRAAASTAFTLDREPGFRAELARLADDDHVLLLLTHHIVSDAWSYGLIFRDLAALYDAERGSAVRLSPVALQYGDYAAWQRDGAHASVLEEGLGYWRSRLADLPVLELPTDFARPQVQGFGGARTALTIEPELYRQLQAIARDTGTTMYMVLLSAYATVLHRYAGQDDIVIGSAVAGRTSAEMESIIGYFSQALPMRVRFDGNPTVRELLGRARDTALGAFEHQDTPLESLVLELQRGGARSHAPLFRVVLTMQDTRGTELTLGDAVITPVELDIDGTKFDLTILANERSDRLDLDLWFRTDLFAHATAERFLGHVRNVLRGFAADRDARVATIPLTSEEERKQLASWNETSLDEGAATTLVAAFESNAARVPDRVAVVAGADQLTFAALNARANQLAHALVAQGVDADTPVGLALDRSANAIVGLLGIVKSGGCYVPLSPDLPAARRAQQVRECGAMVVVADANAPAGLDEIATVIRVDDGSLDSQPTTNPARGVKPESTAYILFTSGSTGVPKGVSVTHANVVHYARAVSRVLTDASGGDGVKAMDGWTFGLVSTLSADLGNTSLLPALIAGGTLHVLSRDAATEPAKFADYVAANPLDVLKATPGHLMALASGRTGSDLARVLPRKWIVLGGEALRLDVARALLGTNSCRVRNHYGPTETTVGVLTNEVTAATLDAAVAQHARTVPLGRPLANTRALVLDASGNEQPVGVPGELWISGAGVTKGYVRRDDLTAERFVVRNGQRTYRTGDRVVRLPDGTVVFMGRADDQVKVRGYRVELGEIEQVLRAHAGVRAGVVAFTGPDDDKRVVAYVVPKAEGYAVSHSDRATPEKITEWMAAQLPEYMVPSTVMMLDELPLTANGKVDRARLPEPGEVAKDNGYQAPRTETEQQLATIWADVLKREKVGVTDNFLALGGHSLLAIRALGKISKSFGVRLPLRTLFEAGTLEQLAGAVDRAVAEK